MLTRRRLLQGLGATLLGGVSRLAHAKVTAEFGAERFDLGHLLVRDGEQLDEAGLKPEREVEVAIVGAGLAGLTAGYLLRDRDLLLLDKEPEAGGHARAGAWRGIPYSLAAAYFAEPHEPLLKFYRDAGLLEGAARIAEPVDQLFSEGHLQPLLENGELERFRNALIKMSSRKGAPTIPVEASAKWALAYDRVSLERYLLEEGFGAGVQTYVALYCRSAFSALPSELSAFAGLNFLMGEVAARYAFPGGTAGAARRLVDRIQAAGSGRLRLDATVARIHPSHPSAPGKALVVYADEAGLHAVAAKAVVVATNKMAAARMVKGLSLEQQRAIAQARRGAALVANVCLREAAPSESYDTWYAGGVGTDVISADWVRSGGPPRPGPTVLTFYCNTMRDHGVLLGQDASTWADRIATDLERLRPGASKEIEEVRLSRFGHAMVCPGPGYITGARALTRQQLGPILFAHSDGQGLPAFEAAIWEGMEAARALGRLHASFKIPSARPAARVSPAPR